MNIRGTLSITAASAVLALGLTGCSSDSSKTSDTPLASSPSTATSVTSTPAQQTNSGVASGTSGSAGASNGSAATSTTGAQHSTAGTSSSATQTSGIPSSATSGSGSSSTMTSGSKAPGQAGTATAKSSNSTPACSTQTAGQAAEAAKRAIPQFNDWAWVVSPDNNHFDRCADLSYIVLGINGTASSPYQIALYHHGAYLGTATKEAYGFYPVVTRTAGNAISVRYTYIQGNECTACATGKAVANFRWSDAAQKVVMTGSVPPAN